MKEIAKKLLKKHKKHWEKIDSIERTGVELPESLKVDLLSLVLDIIGVPKDTTTTTKKDTDSYYCRDHFWDVYSNMDVEDFINYADSCIEEYNEYIGEKQ